MRTPKNPFSCQRGELTIRGYVFGEQAPGKHAVILSHGFSGADDRDATQILLAFMKC